MTLYQRGLAVSVLVATWLRHNSELLENECDNAPPMFMTGYNAARELQFTEFCLDYAKLPDANEGVKNAIVSAFSTTMESSDGVCMTGVLLRCASTSP